MEMDAARYYEFIAKVMEMPGEEEDETPQEFKEAIGELTVLVGDMFSRMDLQIVFTERGVEFPSTIELAE